MFSLRTAKILINIILLSLILIWQFIVFRSGSGSISVNTNQIRAQGESYRGIQTFSTQTTYYWQPVNILLLLSML